MNITKYHFSSSVTVMSPAGLLARPSNGAQHTRSHTHTFSGTMTSIFPHSSDDYDYHQMCLSFYHHLPFLLCCRLLWCEGICAITSHPPPPKGGFAVRSDSATDGFITLGNVGVFCLWSSRFISCCDRDMLECSL